MLRPLRLVLLLLGVGLAAPARAGDVADTFAATTEAEAEAARELGQLTGEQDGQRAEIARAAERLAEVHRARTRLEAEILDTEAEVARLAAEVRAREIATGRGLARLAALERRGDESRPKLVRAGVLAARLLDPWQAAAGRLAERRAASAALRERLDPSREDERAAAAALATARSQGYGLELALAAAEARLDELRASRAVAEERVRLAVAAEAKRLAAQAGAAPTGSPTVVAPSQPAAWADPAEPAPVIASDAMPAAGIVGDRTAEPAARSVAEGMAPAGTAHGVAERDPPGAGIDARAILAGGLERLPLTGPVVAGFGEARDGRRNRGVLIAGRNGQPVDAPRSGIVAFAGEFKSYGLLLIIDHGDDYHTLLSGMSGLDVGRGDLVRSGQRVGTLAAALDGGPVLYMELRRGGVPVDPMPALAAREDKVRG